MEKQLIHAPALQGTAWFNTERPIKLDELRGKLVLLDFWTYCCINCLHVLEDLKYLEDRYRDRPFVVIGVHSPKFAHEDDPESVRQAIVRYGITHPVILDSGRRTWDAYAVRGWPTVGLVDHQGYLLGKVAGESNRDRLDAIIGQALDAIEALPGINTEPLPIRLESDRNDLVQTSPLLYPGKVLADDVNQQLFIADTGHHRIVAAQLDGTNSFEIGSGEPGAMDGDWATASFRSPQGMALDSERQLLYVADTGNHLIRCIDLTNQSVTTVAGTGKQNNLRFPFGPARETALNSPWDITFVDGLLYIAMAGPHQIWRWDPATETVGVYAGSGGEGRLDGVARDAAFAQPSGITTDGRHLYIADSEISCIRALDTGAKDITVTTLAGGDLFDFGARDGVGDVARFQHPLGLVWVHSANRPAGMIFIADTYNHLIRWLDPATGQVKSFAGTTEVSAIDGRRTTATFQEPSGISFAAGTLYIADTNNHAIRLIHMSDDTVTTLAFPGLCAPGFCLPG